MQKCAQEPRTIITPAGASTTEIIGRSSSYRQDSTLQTLHDRMYDVSWQLRPNGADHPPLRQPGIVTH